jgi:hypothetical protein
LHWQAGRDLERVLFPLPYFTLITHPSPLLGEDKPLFLKKRRFPLLGGDEGVGKNLLVIISFKIFGIILTALLMLRSVDATFRLRLLKYRRLKHAATNIIPSIESEGCVKMPG